MLKLHKTYGCIRRTRNNWPKRTSTKLDSALEIGAAKSEASCSNLQEYPPAFELDEGFTTIRIRSATSHVRYGSTISPSPALFDFDPSALGLSSIQLLSIPKSDMNSQESFIS